MVSAGERKIMRAVVDALGDRTQLIVARILPIPDRGADSECWAAYLTGFTEVRIDNHHPADLPDDDPDGDLSAPVGSGHTKSEAVGGLARMLKRLTFGYLPADSAGPAVCVAWDRDAGRLAVVDISVEPNPSGGVDE